jgi:Xaa-Pro aminopeptidase
LIELSVYLKRVYTVESAFLPSRDSERQGRVLKKLLRLLTLDSNSKETHQVRFIINGTNKLRWPLLLCGLAVSALLSLPVFGQSAPYYQSHFPPEEFKARWQKMFERIGDNAIAIVQGAPKARGFNMPRQSNEFYYLSGIETPHSYLLLDGRNRKVTLYLPPRDERLERSEGRILSADDAELVKRLTGVDAVSSTQLMTEGWMRDLLKGSPPPLIYTLFTPAEGSAESRHELQSADASIAADYWDGRVSREAHFIQLLRTRFPRAEVRDLTPILDELRSVKSQREIALIRRASQLSGLGLLEAIRNTKPGIFEYQLDAVARYIFLAHGARLEGYRSITASGTKNIWNAHYYRNSDQLKAGDLVLMDFAPDYGYYTSDVARMWPVNGKFNREQRELLQFVLDYRNEIMKRIRPGVTPKSIREEARAAMEDVFRKTKFSKPIYEQAARKLVETGGGVFSHPVGMAVHDDGDYSKGVLQAGHVFSVDPQLWVPEENLYMRYEDVIVVTEKGIENFTDFLPTELDEIEKLVGQGGILQSLPPLPQAKK